jgi:hypothetical protein
MSTPGATDPAPADDTATVAAPEPGHARTGPRTGALRSAGAAHARRVFGAYAGEHGVYGIVLVSALVAAEFDADTDWDVIVFVTGTVGVFWLAHVYAAVVASRGRRPVPPLWQAIRHGIGHSSGMALAMFIPVICLATGTLGILDEWTAYYLALASGMVVLAVIGYLNAWRNGSTWPWRVAGVGATLFLGAIVIALSIWAHS